MYLDIYLLFLLFVSSSYAILQKTPKFSIKVWQWFHGQGGHTFGANPRNHRVSGVEPQAKAVKFGQVVVFFFFFRGRDTHINMSKKTRETNYVPQKKTSEVTHTHTHPVWMWRKWRLWKGCWVAHQIFFWYFLMIFAQTAFLRGRPTVIVENCSHGLYHGGLRKCNTRLWLCLIRFIGILGVESFLKTHLTLQVFGGWCFHEGIKTLRNSPNQQLDTTTTCLSTKLST